jgi:pimeloyl-ACP methyl ester carboxylesterase
VQILVAPGVREQSRSVTDYAVGGFDCMGVPRMLRSPPRTQGDRNGLRHFEGGASIFYEDWGIRSPVVFSHGWPLNGDAWTPLLLASNGFRAVAHDRPGHSRSSQPWDGNTTHDYADDLAPLIETLDLRDVVLVGHPTGGGEAVLYVARHGTARVSKVVLVGAIPPLTLKTADNPNGTPIEVFDALRANVLAHRSQLYKDLAKPFYGTNRPSSNVSHGTLDQFWLMGHAGRHQGGARLHQAVLRERLQPGPEDDHGADARHPRRRRSDRPHGRVGAPHPADRPGRRAGGLPSSVARPVCDTQRAVQR